MLMVNCTLCKTNKRSYESLRRLPSYHIAREICWGPISKSEALKVSLRPSAWVAFPADVLRGSTRVSAPVEPLRTSAGEASTGVVCYPSPIFKPGNLRCVKLDSMLSRLSPTKGVKGHPRGSQCTSNSSFPHPLSSRKLKKKKSAKITVSSISPYSHNTSFSPSSLHFRPDFSLLPILYLPPLFVS